MIDMRHEPVRIPGYVALVAAMLVAGLSAYVAGGWVAGVIAGLGVIVPGAIGVEAARARAWSPESVELAVDSAFRDDPSAAPPMQPEQYLREAKAQP